jgi:hypothetical protein
MTRARHIAFLVLLSAALGSCLQHTLEPDQATRHQVVVQTLKPTGTIAKQVDVSIYDNNTGSAPQLFAGNTGDSGLVRALLNIPVGGKTYSLRAKKIDPLGGLLFARTYYPLFLACADTVVQIIVPEAETGPETASRIDSLCGNDVDRTLTFYACSDSSVSIDYTIKNCSASPMTLTASGVNAPFLIAPTSAQVAPNATTTFTFTYSGVGQTSDKSAQIKLTSAPAQGTATLTLIGHLQYDCPSRTQPIVCGVRSQSDSAAFGTVCLNEQVGPHCTSFENTTNAAINVSLPTARAPFSYIAYDPSGAQISGNSILLQPNQSVTFCVSVKPTQAGHTVDSLVVPFSCTNASGTFVIPMSVDAKVCVDECTCSDYIHDPYQIGTNVPVGQDTTVTLEFFRNKLACPVTIANVVLDNNPTWTLVSTSASIPATVAAGSTLSATVRFRPGKAGKSAAHLNFTITPQGQQTSCPGQIELMAGGCHSACVTFTLPPHYHPAATDPNGPDTLYFEQAGSPKVLVAQAGSTSLSDPEIIRIRYPDTSCANKHITIVPPAIDRWDVTTSPSPLTLAPGQEGTITIVFKAPEIRDVRKKFTLPGMELKYPDLIKIIDPDGCEKDAPLKAVVDTLPECKEFDLSVYGFVGSQNVIYREAYGFDVGREDNVVQGGTPGFPASGDIFLKDPTTFSSVKGSTPPGFALWKNDPTPICNNIAQVSSSLSAKNPASLTYNSTIGISQYDWIIVHVKPGVYAVIQITTMYTDGYNIAHAVCSVLYPFYF